MPLSAGQRWGVLGGLAGAVFGGLVWVVVAGFYLGDAIVVASAGVVGLGLWWLAARLLLRAPERFPAIFGAVLLGLVVIEWIYLALLLPRLPVQRVSTFWDISQPALEPVPTILLAGGIAGTSLLIWDFTRKR